ncbi:hypothetical protein FE257_008768 [Aspergillus nanangensis]|uniref:Uncharacterized protein n=1 Tax=Aspergillus nanangensis TaxID=2582783 RepID=A0AAD4CKR5_ASPNN|nr:hypothetical protein FE257_008768 [Aspergillus nanangensis]
MTKVEPAADGESAAAQLPGFPVEARSLSSVTAIASNPPAYPRNPTQKKLDPLVLYIVRVPGSRDVFLSPLKPPTKASVSAEAINASLYYLHVASPDDEVLLEEYKQEREEAARIQGEQLGDEGDEVDIPLEFARMNQVRRKPVPGGDAAAPEVPPLPVRPSLEHHQLQPQLSPEDVIPPPVPPRPAFSQHLSLGDLPLDQVSRGDPASAPSLPARPLPPVPRDEMSFETQDTFAPRKTNRWSALSGYMSSRGLESIKDKYDARVTGHHHHHSFDPRETPRVRPHSASGGSPSHSRSHSPARSPGQSPTRRSYDSRPPDRPGFHITLIRRDPTHGSQWNVATMSTPRMDGSAIDLDITTPGYNRFLTQNEPMSLASLGLNLSSNSQPISLSSLKQAAAPPTESKESTDMNNSSESSHQPRRFNRKLCVSRPYQSDESRASLDMQGSTNRASIDSARQHFSQLKSGYYTFTSPWNGTCTFSTSINGRSLKCKHIIPMPGFSNTSDTSVDNPAVTVAEIRFNTPFQAGHLHHQPGPPHISPFALSQTPTFPNDPSTTNTGALPTDPLHPPQTRSSKRASFAQFLNPNAYSNRPTTSASQSSQQPSSSGFVPGTAAGGGAGGGRGIESHRRKPSTSSSSSADVDPPALPPRPPQHHRFPSEDRIDFSLARERAGGGMRGKSAKLGKLIIEDEGIKMLDLVVAACMAVWWRGYYY